MPTYDRPIQARLQVHLENGESWEATPEDLEKFGYADHRGTYARFANALWDVLHARDLIDRDITEAMLNPVRYLVEAVVAYPETLGLVDPEDHAEIAVIEEFLQEHRAEIAKRVDARYGREPS